MSIWSDTAIKELQEKVVWLEKELAELKREKAARDGPSRETLTRSRVNGSR